METTDTTENELTMLVGTYTSGTSKGIYSYRFNEKDGTATPLSETEIENPSYLIPSADGKFVYAVSEFNNKQAAANAFAFNKEKGTLELLNSQQTGGEDPCYIIANENNVITANQTCQIKSLAWCINCDCSVSGILTYRLRRYMFIAIQNQI